MTRYTRGADFERKVKKHLEAYAWSVTRSAGSHGLADLVAIAPGPVVAYVQCKRDARLSKQDRIDLVTHCLAFDCVPILAFKSEMGISYLELFEGAAPMEWYPCAK
jgi:Holliday junction resolvase